MFRKRLINLLLDNPMSVAEIARENKIQIKEVAMDLEHLRKSLRHSEHVLAVNPARCRKCGFEFNPEKLTKPSRCPKCRATWIIEPRVRVRRR